MDKDELNKFKEILLKHKTRILNGGILKSSEDLHVSPDDLADETDLATTVINQQVTFNIRQREFRKLRAIEAALYRIEDGTYGYCEECDELIGNKRLVNQPWTTLCITHAEERERESALFLRQA
ncbi:MAG: TraR/DksA family transcriptional regulator [Bacteriovoracaceae bacterium]|nr:TraR/DksA family transcriptional regulator [Candidatus Brocadiales bacterium]MBL6990977.1 TraR/DksA family transcriptional regulator [Bacteriovoracaceae bacterium]